MLLLLLSLLEFSCAPVASGGNWSETARFDGETVVRLCGDTGLRLDGERQIRAKYPNGDPEQSGHFLPIQLKEAGFAAGELKELMTGTAAC